MIRQNLHWKHYCNGNYSDIENYDKAIADKDNVWEIHHRDEIRVLPSGMVARRSVQELIECGLYYNLPPEYLIFLPKSEHMRMHKIGNNGLIGNKHSEETKSKMRERAMGHSVSSSTREKLRKFHTGLKASDETRRKMSESRTGKHLGPCPEERKQKIRLSLIRYNAKRRGDSVCQ